MNTDDILALMLRNMDVALMLKEAMRSPLVLADPFQRQIAEFVADFVDTEGTLPRKGDYEAWMGTLDERRGTGVAQAIQRLNRRKTDELTPSFAASVAIEQLRQTASENMASRLAMMDNITEEDITALYEQLQAIEPITLSNVANLRDVDTWAVPEEQEDSIPTGIPRLDQWVGGFRRGELIFVLADSGVGKSAALINHGYSAVLTGHNVLHITLELSQRASAIRFYRRVAEADKAEFRSKNATVRTGIKHWWKFAKGNYYLAYFPPYTFSAEDLYQFVKLFIRHHGDIDVLILDYLDLMEPPKGTARLGRHEQLGRSSHSVRGCGVEHQYTTLSATQATRPKGDEHETLSLSKMGDAYTKVRASDLVIGFVRTREEIEACQGRYQILKARETGGRGADIPLYVNMDLMMIGDLDHPNVRKIIGELGHDYIPVKQWAADGEE